MSKYLILSGVLFVFVTMPVMAQDTTRTVQPGGETPLGHRREFWGACT